MRSTFSLSASLLLTSLSLRATADRAFTVTNNCAETIWPVVQSSGTGGSYSGPTGFELASGAVQSLTMPDDWQGVIWPRRECSFDSTGAGSCATGDSTGHLEPNAPTAPFDTNSVEFALNNGGTDLYDQSQVNGFTLPITLAADGYTTIACTTDLLPSCPDALKKVDGNGATVACLSACAAQYGDVDANCCSGSHNLPSTCPSSGVDFYSYFKDGCPSAYAYAYDDSSATAVVYSCASAAQPGYQITFCGAAPARKMRRRQLK